MYHTIAYKVLQNHCNHEIIINSFYHWLNYLENSALKFSLLMFTPDITDKLQTYDEMVHFAFLDTVIHISVSIIFIKFDDDKCIKVYIFKKEMAQGSQLQ